MRERGIHVDHSTIHRWVRKYAPQIEEAFHRRKRPVWLSWRLEETYLKVKGPWRSLYRAVDKSGQTSDFLLTEQRDKRAARRFLTKVIRRHGVPETITIDGSEANAAAIRGYNRAHGTAISIRQVKYLNNVVEQDHRAVKRVTRPLLGCKSFDAAQSTLAGIALMHMLRKGQLQGGAAAGCSAVEQCYSLAASSPFPARSTPPKRLRANICDLYGPGPDVKEPAGSTSIGTDALIYSACRGRP
jgi:putative transposase